MNKALKAFPTEQGGLLGYLQEENRALKEQLSALNNELLERAAPSVGNLIDALNRLSGLAQAGNPQAKAVLKLLVKALDDARAASTGLALVSGNGTQ